jgi:hypothetical protein
MASSCGSVGRGVSGTCAMSHPQPAGFRGWNSAASLTTPISRSFGTTTDHGSSPPKNVVYEMI